MTQYIASRRLNNDGRRWSRRVNYGSQLLCELININNLPPPPSPPIPKPPPPPVPPNMREMGDLRRRKRYPLELQKAIRDVQFIKNHMRRYDEYDAVIIVFPVSGYTTGRVDVDYESVQSTKTLPHYDICDCITNRRTRTGASLPWFSIDCSCGSSQ